jgi:hypothetical protein
VVLLDRSPDENAYLSLRNMVEIRNSCEQKGHPYPRKVVDLSRNSRNILFECTHCNDIYRPGILRTDIGFLGHIYDLIRNSAHSYVEVSHFVTRRKDELS